MRRATQWGQNKGRRDLLVTSKASAGVHPSAEALTPRKHPLTIACVSAIIYETPYEWIWANTACCLCMSTMLQERLTRRLGSKTIHVSNTMLQTSISRNGRHRIKETIRGLDVKRGHRAMSRYTSAKKAEKDIVEPAETC